MQKYKVKKDFFYVDWNYKQGDILEYNSILCQWGLRAYHTYYQRMFFQDYINEHPELFEVING